jgi:hypothetical protein
LLKFGDLSLSELKVAKRSPMLLAWKSARQPVSA